MEFSNVIEHTGVLKLCTLSCSKTYSKIKSEGKVEKSGNYYKYLLEGHSFKLGEDLLPELYKPFKDVCEALNFNEPIEFYISNAPDFNASASSSQEEGEPHLVNLNSGLVNALDEDELRFVIGHELGHIISKNIDIKGVIDFVFPNYQGIPLLLYNKISLWDKLSELDQHRSMFIASAGLVMAGVDEQM